MDDEINSDRALEITQEDRVIESNEVGAIDIETTLQLNSEYACLTSDSEMQVFMLNIYDAENFKTDLKIEQQNIINFTTKMGVEESEISPLNIKEYGCDFLAHGESVSSPTIDAEDDDGDRINPFDKHNKNEIEGTMKVINWLDKCDLDQDCHSTQIDQEQIFKELNIATEAFQNLSLKTEQEDSLEYNKICFKDNTICHPNFLKHVCDGPVPEIQVFMPIVDTKGDRMVPFNEQKGNVEENTDNFQENVSENQASQEHVSHAQELELARDSMKPDCKKPFSRIKLKKADKRQYYKVPNVLKFNIPAEISKKSKHGMGNTVAINHNRHNPDKNNEFDRRNKIISPDSFKQKIAKKREYYKVPNVLHLDFQAETSKKSNQDMGNIIGINHSGHNLAKNDGNDKRNKVIFQDSFKLKNANKREYYKVANVVKLDIPEEISKKYEQGMGESFMRYYYY